MTDEVGRRGRQDWEMRRQTPANHRADDVVGFQSARHVGLHVFAIAEDRDAVGNGKHLLQPVRDIDDANAVTFQRPDDAEQHVDFL